MNADPAIRSLFKRHYFWDVDISKLDPVKNQRLIIERILTFGSMKEINLLMEHYGKPAVINICRQISYLDPKTLNFISKLFELPEGEFRCHSGKLSKNIHWSS